jgi:hypothetical protein
MRSEEDEAKYEATLRDGQRLGELSQNPRSPYGPFILSEMWEHEFAEWSKVRNGHRHLRRILNFNKHWCRVPLRPRDAFFGGRTNSIKHSIQRGDLMDGWRLKYLDFTSLYPAVMWGVDKQLWPVGHPKIYIGSEVMGAEGPAPQLEEAFGLWKVVVHPPKHLHHPVLGQSINGKLVFPLCMTCAVAENKDYCDHSRAERAIHGTFFTEELKLAKRMGYEVDVPVEIWDWPPEQRTPHMFRGIIGDMYAKKALASPVGSETEIQEMITELLSLTGISYTPEDFQENPSLRALAKFTINNIWGYLGKRSDVVEVKVTKDLNDLYRIRNDPKLELVSINVSSQCHQQP